MFHSCEEIKTGTLKEKALTKAVAKFICKSGLPIYTAEKEPIKELLHTFEPR